MTEAEVAFAQAAQRWRLRRGLSPARPGRGPRRARARVCTTRRPGSPPGWSTSTGAGRTATGEVERRFSKDELCDFLTIYWATGTIASSMRLYAAEARDRWRLAAGERIEVPAAVADFPARARPPAARVEPSGCSPTCAAGPSSTAAATSPPSRSPSCSPRDLTRVPGRALSAALTLAVLADTHLPRGTRRLPDACVERLRAADLVIHAGDFSTVAAYEEIAGSAASWSRVHGNVDDAELRRPPARAPRDRRSRRAPGSR